MKTMEIIFTGVLFTVIASNLVRSENMIVCSGKYYSNETLYKITCNHTSKIVSNWTWHSIDSFSKLPNNLVKHNITNLDDSSTITFKRSSIINDMSITSKYGEFESPPIRLVTKTRIEQNPIKTHLVLTEGSHLTFECLLFDNETVAELKQQKGKNCSSNWKWTRGKEELTKEDEYIHIECSDTTDGHLKATLRIENVKTVHEGDYTCYFSSNNIFMTENSKTFQIKTITKSIIVWTYLAAIFLVLFLCILIFFYERVWSKRNIHEYTFTHEMDIDIRKGSLTA